MSRPYLSLVFPAFNEAERLPRTLDRCVEYLRGRGYSFEIIVVDDGSVDGTSEVARGCMEGKDVDFRVIRFETNRGKGHVVKSGLLEAKGDVLFFSDADLSTPIEELEKMLPLFAEGWDVVIGSRGLSDSDIRRRQPAHRGIAGRVFNVLVQLLVLPGIRDTQCGFKGFARKTIEPITSVQRVLGFAFDVEMLLIARRLGYSIKEVPVIWHDDGRSKIRLFRDGLGMFLDLLKIKFFYRENP